MRRPTVHELRWRLRRGTKRAALGRWRPLAEPLHTRLIEAELAIQRAVDRRTLGADGLNDPRLRQVTALVKTVARPRVVLRLMESVARLCPDLAVVLAHEQPAPPPMPNVTLVPMPDGSGLSAGRRQGLKRITTELTLLLDDDFVFYRRTDLARAVAYLRRNPQVDIVGGTVVDLPFWTSHDYRGARLFSDSRPPIFAPGSRIDGLRVHDKVANFFVARTESLRRVNWLPQLKLMEHRDFFSRARGVLTTVHDSDLRCLHAQTPFDDRYMALRRDIASSQAALVHLHGFPLRAARKRPEQEP